MTTYDEQLQRLEDEYLAVESREPDTPCALGEQCLELCRISLLQSDLLLEDIAARRRLQRPTMNECLFEAWKLLVPAFQRACREGKVSEAELVRLGIPTLSSDGSYTDDSELLERFIRPKDEVIKSRQKESS